MAEPFTLEMFAPHIGSKFTMQCGNSGTVELELESVADLGSSARHIQFSIIFVGPQNAPLEQTIYRLDNSELGPMDLFLVPISKDPSGVRYEAIVNRGVES
jgi:hypothetical protein